VRDMLPCAVRFLGRALDSVHWGVISSQIEGVGFLHKQHSLYTNSSAFPVKMLRTNIIPTWLQGAVGSKADIKSQIHCFN